MRIRIGTRGSRLALVQARSIAARLRAHGHETIEVIVQTLGDRDQTSAFPEFGSPGVFVREIERALVAETIDLAVHSYKDLPSTGPDDLVIAAVPERLDAADQLLIRTDVLELDRGRLAVGAHARIGTSSARRAALLRGAREDLSILPLRGNVDTRIRKLRTGEYDAIVLAGAGLTRLEAAGISELGQNDDVHVQRLDPEWFVPAPTQGALALQIRRDDAALAKALSVLHDEAVARPLVAERLLLARVEGSCQLPFGAWCTTNASGFRLVFALGDGERLLVDRVDGDDATALAERAWQRLTESELRVQ